MRDGKKEGSWIPLIASVVLHAILIGLLVHLSFVHKIQISPPMMKATIMAPLPKIKEPIRKPEPVVKTPEPEPEPEPEEEEPEPLPVVKKVLPKPLPILKPLPKPKKLEAKKTKLKRPNLNTLRAEQEKMLQEQLAQEEEALQTLQSQEKVIQSEVEKIVQMQHYKVSQNWLSQAHFLGKGLSTKLEIRLSSTGAVLSVEVVQGSGDDALDLSAKNAVLKSSPLPVPSDPRAFSLFKRYRFTFRPDEVNNQG